MNKIIIIILLIIVFFIGKYSYGIIFFVEKQFNKTKICNNTEYDITSIQINGYRHISPSISFIEIKNGECSEFKKSFWIDNKTSISLKLINNGDLYEFKYNSIDSNSFMFKKVGKHTLNIDELLLEGNSGKIIKQPIMGINFSWE